MKGCFFVMISRDGKISDRQCDVTKLDVELYY